MQQLVGQQIVGGFISDVLVCLRMPGCNALKQSGPVCPVLLGFFGLEAVILSVNVCQCTTIHLISHLPLSSHQGRISIKAETCRLT